ncbi:MAG: hypothetical protein MRZ79_14305 [Bacteroidia bacterium]|nr:hypothetical protein [Bacteroidia bacterium]
MKKYLILFIFMPILAWSQDSTKTSFPAFPESWEGKYAGQLNIFGAREVKMSIPMELHIESQENSRNYKWTIIYKGEKEDIRKYELLEIDKEKGHYQVDEKNSIYLDSYIFGNTLSSRFKVNGSLLIVNYSMNHKKEELTFELFWGGTKDIKETGLEDKENTVFSYSVSTRHQAILKKIN